MAATLRVEAIILEFSGNALTPCMAGLSYYTPAYYAKYRADTMAAISTWVRTGAHVFLIGAPVTRQQQESVPLWDALNLQYAQIAAADPVHVTYVDAGAAVEGPGGVYSQTLPCLIGEPCTGPVVDGVPSNVVRAADGVHFCPVAEVADRVPGVHVGSVPVRRRHGARPRGLPPDGVAVGVRRPVRIHLATRSAPGVPLGESTSTWTGVSEERT